MDGIQGAVLQIKLRHLEKGNRLRQSHAAHYDRAFDNLEEIITPVKAAWSDHVYHIYAIRVERRDDVARSLAEAGIGCGIHYPVPVHLQEAYYNLGYQRGDFPVAERCSDEFLSLPMFPELNHAQIEFVVQAVKDAVNVRPEFASNRSGSKSRRTRFVSTSRC
jgi:dTDP-4-amino-4,6-dideoxygalactose transaminase